MLIFIQKEKTTQNLSICIMLEELLMKNLEKVRSRLNRAISSGRSKSDILGISRRLDVLIVEEMKQQIIKKGT